VKHAAAFLLFGITLWWLWQLLTGEWSRYEWVAGGIAAVIAAVLAELVVTRTKGRARFPTAILAAAPKAFAMVFADFATIMLVLARRQRGTLRHTKFPHPDDEPHRVWATFVAQWSPNAFIIDITDGQTTSHHLVRRDASQRPA
jgi:hypothetical protein